MSINWHERKKDAAGVSKISLLLLWARKTWRVVTTWRLEGHVKSCPAILQWSTVLNYGWWMDTDLGDTSTGIYIYIVSEDTTVRKEVRNRLPREEWRRTWRELEEHNGACCFYQGRKGEIQTAPHNPVTKEALKTQTIKRRRRSSQKQIWACRNSSSRSSSVGSSNMRGVVRAAAAVVVAASRHAITQYVPYGDTGE